MRHRIPETIASAFGTVLVALVLMAAPAPANAAPPVKWPIVTSPNIGSSDNFLTRVSCPTATFCAAVGSVPRPLGVGVLADPRRDLEWQRLDCRAQSQHIPYAGQWLERRVVHFGQFLHRRRLLPRRVRLWPDEKEEITMRIQEVLAAAPGDWISQSPWESRRFR